jgi:macrolide transport system ATP-binding/permease protein
MTRSRGTRGLHGVLLGLGALALLVPASRRQRWLDQWRAELWHFDLWMSRDGVAPFWRVVRLAGRASGAAPHAVLLRLLDWSPRMLIHDVRSGWRLLVRRPALTAVTVTIMGLGIGANATIFSWIESVLVNPLPGVHAQDRLVVVRGVFRGRDNLAISYPDFQDVRAAKVDGLEDLTAFRVVAMNVRTADEPMRAFGELVTPNFLRVLGVGPEAGRDLRDDEGETPGRAPVVMVSHAFWARALNSDPAAIGRTIAINTQPFTIVGVTPQGFHGSIAGMSLDLFLPMTMQKTVIAEDRLGDRGTGWLQVYGRLAPGATFERARAGLAVAGARLAAAFPAADAGRSLRGSRLSEDGASALLMPVMATLMVVVAVVLLIACANVAGLLLARASERRREIAVRLAVGASRGRLIRQLLVENLMLAAAGGVAGIVLARWTSGLLALLVPPTPYPLGFHASVSARVVVFAIAMTCVTAIVSGLLPALRGSRSDLAVALKASAPANGGGGRGRLRQALVVAQVALSLLLLVCAALFLRSLVSAERMDPGYAARQGVFGSLDLLAGGYDRPRGLAFYQQALSRIGSVPGVTHASLATALPLDLGAGSDSTVEVEGYQPRKDEPMHAFYSHVGPGYFETLGIDIVEGRGITSRDTASQPPVLVINETMAKRYFQGRHAVGSRVRFGGRPLTVVGVARDGKYAQLTESPPSYVYMPILQTYRPDATLIVRTAGEPFDVLPAVQRELHALDPALPLFDVRTIAEHRRISVFLPKMASTLLGVFGGLALMLAVVGLYGVVAYSVSQRTREIGVRVALGATRRDILSLVVRQGLHLAAAGAAIGLLLAWLAAGAVRAQLVGIPARDPITFMTTAALLLIVAVCACAVPARRAAGLDPVSALRNE